MPDPAPEPGKTKLYISVLKFGVFAYIGYSTGSNVIGIVREFVTIAPFITYPVLTGCAFLAGAVGFRTQWVNLVTMERNNVAQSQRDELKTAEEKKHKDKIELATTELTQMKCIKLLRDRSILKQVVADEDVQMGLATLGYIRATTPSHTPAEPTPVRSHAIRRLSARQRSEDNIVISIAGKEGEEPPSPYSLSQSSSRITSPHSYENKESPSPRKLEQKDSPVISAFQKQQQIEQESYPFMQVPRLTEAPLLATLKSMPLPLRHARVATSFFYNPTLPTAVEGPENSASPLTSIRLIRLAAPSEGSPLVSQRELSNPSTPSSRSRGIWIPPSPLTSHRSSATAPSPQVSQRGLSTDPSPMMSHRGISSSSYVSASIGYSPQISNRDLLPGASPQMGHHGPYLQPPTEEAEFKPPPMRRSASDRANEIRAFFDTDHERLSQIPAFFDGDSVFPPDQRHHDGRTHGRGRRASLSPRSHD
jgi:hypothetical protein